MLGFTFNGMLGFKSIAIKIIEMNLARFLRFLCIYRIQANAIARRLTGSLEVLAWGSHPHLTRFHLLSPRDYHYFAVEYNRLAKEPSNIRLWYRNLQAEPCYLLE